MIVRDLMQPKVQTARPETTLADIVITLADAHVTAVPVVDRDHRVLGVVSIADILARQAEARANDGEWETLTADDVMTRPALTIGALADVQEALKRFLYTEVHRLFVEEDGKLAGVLSQSDVVRAFASRRLTV